MLAAIFMWKPTGIAALFFHQELSRPIKRRFCTYISWNAENRIEPYRTMLLMSFQESSVNNIKVLATFQKIFNFAYLEN